MNLQDFFARVTPYLLGSVPYSEAVRQLYPAAELDTPDAKRLEIYGRFCRTHRQEAASVFGYCRSAVEAWAGEQAWVDFIEEYFRAHPMCSWELNENGEKLPGFLATHPLSERLPFLRELSDFEWWEWLVAIAPDQPFADEGPLRLSPLVELRQYEYDFVSWLDEAGASENMASAGPPQRQECFVLFWRDRELDGRRAEASPLELLALKLVSEGQTVDELLRQGVQAPADELRETLADLHAAGILMGQLDPAA